METENSDRYALLNRLADEFATRYRRGERPALQPYVDRYPDLADEIRDLFPAMVEIEQVKEEHRQADQEALSVSGDGLPLEQLGDYRILREIGRGGMGIVYEAEQISLGRHVAVKVLPAHALLEPRQRGRFEREAKAAAKLHHTNIVPVYGVGECEGVRYYVMQFIHGLGLDEVLTELRRLRQPLRVAPGGTRSIQLEGAKEVSASAVAQALLSGQFRRDLASTGEEKGGAKALVEAAPPRPAHTEGVSGTVSSTNVHLPGQSERSSLSDSGRAYWQSVARLGMQVAEALAYAAGQGILHRDIKPSNLLLDTQGTVWVTDLGWPRRMPIRTT